MRTEFGFAPLYRHSIGFDRVFNLRNNAQRLQAADNWPPYDIAKVGDDEDRICMAVAGYGEGDLDIKQERNVLVVKGGKAEESQVEYCPRHGRTLLRAPFRAGRPCQGRGCTASLKNGLVDNVLKQEIPEEMKPSVTAVNLRHRRRFRSKVKGKPARGRMPLDEHPLSPYFDVERSMFKSRPFSILGTSPCASPSSTNS